MAFHLISPILDAAQPTVPALGLRDEPTSSEQGQQVDPFAMLIMALAVAPQTATVQLPVPAQPQTDQEAPPALLGISDALSTLPPQRLLAAASPSPTSETPPWPGLSYAEPSLQENQGSVPLPAGLHLTERSPSPLTPLRSDAGRIAPVVDQPPQGRSWAVSEPAPLVSAPAETVRSVSTLSTEPAATPAGLPQVAGARTLVSTDALQVTLRTLATTPALDTLPGAAPTLPVAVTAMETPVGRATQPTPDFEAEIGAVSPATAVTSPYTPVTTPPTAVARLTPAVSVPDTTTSPAVSTGDVSALISAHDTAANTLPAVPMPAPATTTERALAQTPAADLVSGTLSAPDTHSAPSSPSERHAAIARTTIAPPDIPEIPPATGEPLAVPQVPPAIATATQESARTTATWATDIARTTQQTTAPAVATPAQGPAPVGPATALGHLAPAGRMAGTVPSPASTEAPTAPVHAIAPTASPLLEDVVSATARRLATVIQEAAKHLTPLRRALGVSSDKVRETSPEAVLVSPQAQPSPGSYLAASALLEDHTTVPDQYPVGASQPAAAVRAPLLRAADPSTEVQHLQLELAPPELGAVTLRLQHHGREVTASLLVDHEQARQVVQHAEVEVRQSLEQQGLQMGAFDVSCRQQGQNHEAPAQQEGLPYLPVTTEVNHEPAPPRSGPSPSPGSPAAIDVYV